MKLCASQEHLFLPVIFAEEFGGNDPPNIKTITDTLLASAGNARAALN